MILTYSGNSSYCYSNSLRMCFEHAGLKDLPSVSFIECLTGMPFGATFLKLDTPLFFPSPAATDPNTALNRALETMGWTCELWQGDGADEAEAALRHALRYGPVLLGPLDMGFLSYDPRHRHKRGGDHFVVVLSVEGDMVELHDPQLYPYAVLTMPELMEAWHARHLGYVKSSYTLRYGFHQQAEVSRQRLLERTLEVARDLQTKHPEGPVAYGGKQAFALAAEELRQAPEAEFTELLVNFTLPLGARRCLDGAAFLVEAGDSTAAGHLAEKAKHFGRAQYYAATQGWGEAADLLDELGEIEDQLAHHFSNLTVR
jgi:hypothetical protein